MLLRRETQTALINLLEQKKKEKNKAQISSVARALNRPGHLPADGSALLRADAGAVWVGSRRFAGLVPVSGLANPCSLIKLCVECEWSVRE